MKQWIFLSGANLALLMLIGCGKPPAAQQGPPPGEWPANAVVAKAEQRQVDDTITLVASLAAKEMISVVSELDARLIAMHVTEGQRVKQGDKLFTLDPAITDARLKEAEANHRMSEMTYKRNKQLVQSKTISQQEYDQSESHFHTSEAALTLARDQHEKTTISAPFKGVIGEKAISPGQFVSRGQRLVSLIQIDPLQVVFDVPERHIGALSDALNVRFKAEAFPDKVFTGKLTFTSPMVDEKSRTLRAKAEIPNPGNLLKPGMFGELSLVLATRAQAVVIPEAAIQLMGGAPLVVTVSAEGVSGFRPVTVGQRFEGFAEVLDGIAAGEMLVIEGFQKMGPGMKVIAAPESEQHGVTPGPLFPQVIEVPEAASTTTNSPAPSAEAPAAAAANADAETTKGPADEAR